MNPDTRVAICCYAGDGHQVINALHQYLHHECPVTVFSPTDSPADIRYPGVESRLVGLVGYIGQVSLDRQLLHLRALLEYPEHHFLFHDSDSLCLSAKIPDYVYAEPDVVWSNVVKDDDVNRPCDTPLPRVALQPPYFFSRTALERMVAIGDQIRIQPERPFIDHYMLQLVMRARLDFKSFPDGRSFPVWQHRDAYGSDVDGISLMEGIVKTGTIMVHAVKHKAAIDVLTAAHLWYNSHR
jgi:hypothetical protein